MANKRKPVSQDRPSTSPNTNAEIRKAFLTQLSETSNVSASVRAAGTNSSFVYNERRRSAAFRTQWQSALEQGYARLEAGLLEEALQVPNGKISEATMKARAQKHRLALALLAAHRASVKHSADKVPLKRAEKANFDKQALITKLHQMRTRNATAK